MSYRFISNRIENRKINFISQLRFKGDTLIPFNDPHCDSLENLSYFKETMKFNQWYRRPDKAFKLYWRTHPKYWENQNDNC